MHISIQQVDVHVPIYKKRALSDSFFILVCGERDSLEKILNFLVSFEALAEIRAPVRGLRRPCAFSKKEKKEPFLVPSSFFAEREGFEPPEPLSSTVFKTAAIDHSAISPRNRLQKYCFFFNCANIFEVFLRMWIFYSNFAPKNSYLHVKCYYKFLNPKYIVSR